jgi:hypothetical protein
MPFAQTEAAVGVASTSVAAALIASLVLGAAPSALLSLGMAQAATSMAACKDNVVPEAALVFSESLAPGWALGEPEHGGHYRGALVAGIAIWWGAGAALLLVGHILQRTWPALVKRDDAGSAPWQRALVVALAPGSHLIVTAFTLNSTFGSIPPLLQLSTSVGLDIALSLVAAIPPLAVVAWGAWYVASVTRPVIGAFDTAELSESRLGVSIVQDERGGRYSRAFPLLLPVDSLQWERSAESGGHAAMMSLLSGSSRLFSPSGTIRSTHAADLNPGESGLVTSNASAQRFVHGLDNDAASSVRFSTISSRCSPATPRWVRWLCFGRGTWGPRDSARLARVWPLLAPCTGVAPMYGSSGVFPSGVIASCRYYIFHCSHFYFFVAWAFAVATAVLRGARFDCAIQSWVVAVLQLLLLVILLTTRPLTVPAQSLLMCLASGLTALAMLLIAIYHSLVSDRTLYFWNGFHWELKAVIIGLKSAAEGLSLAATATAIPSLLLAVAAALALRLETIRVDGGGRAGSSNPSRGLLAEYFADELTSFDPLGGVDNHDGDDIVKIDASCLESHEVQQRLLRAQWQLASLVGVVGDSDAVAGVGAINDETHHSPVGGALPNFDSHHFNASQVGDAARQNHSRSPSASPPRTPRRIVSGSDGVEHLVYML